MKFLNPINQDMKFFLYLNTINQDIKTKIHSLNIFSIKNIPYLLIIILFITIAYMIYKKVILDKINNDFVFNKEPQMKNKTGKNSSPVLMFFKTDWCPYCRVSLKEWDKLKEDINNLNYDREDGDKISSAIIDCDIDERVCKKYDVKEFPTIKLLYKGREYLYNAKPIRSDMFNFLNEIVS